jgi:hypothetical protein
MANKSQNTALTVDTSLDNLKEANEREHLAVFNFLMQRTGYDRVQTARAENPNFDAKDFWQKYKPAFTKAHSGKPTSELMAHITRLFGLTTIQEVKDANARRANAVQKRTARQRANAGAV